MVKIYIKHTDNNFYLLDIDPNEVINIKQTAKDLNDITKIFSPFTQSFNIKATDKNKILCGFIGNEKILRANNTGEFDALIYVGGFLFQSGKLTFDETDYEFRDQKSFKTTFGSTISSLSEKLGDSTIQDAFDLSDPLLNVVWNSTSLRDRLQSSLFFNLASGVPFRWGVPFISNKRAWVYNPGVTNVLDNIAYNQFRNNVTENYVAINEVRPAVGYLSIIQSIIKKYDLNVTCPLFSRPELSELSVWCNSEKLVDNKSETFPLINYTALTTQRINDHNDPGVPGFPETPKWNITGGGATGIFKIKRDEAVLNPMNWNSGMDLNITFNGLTAQSGGETSVRVITRRTTDGAVLDSQDIEGNTYTYRIIDNFGGPTILDGNGELFFKIEVLPVTLVTWSSISFQIVQNYHKQGWSIYDNCDFVSNATNNTPSANLGANRINLISTLPKMKCVDFLSSFFKTFNISVIPTGLNDNSMFWLTPEDINEVNKPYSKRIVDYTKFTDVQTIEKKRGNQYNQYILQHATSKYYDSVYGDGTRFGSLTFPLVSPAKPTKFEVKTNYSILKPSTAFVHPIVKMCLGFEKSTPEVNENGANRYKPVFEELTIFYMKNKSLQNLYLSSEGSVGSNNKLLVVNEASFINYTNGKTVAFGAEGSATDSLYLNYYKIFIELLLSPNTYATTFNLELPPNEIFLNFANTTQGESNIPTGFRIQNEIIIGEQRYVTVDSAIKLTDGKTKLTLLNL